MGNKSIKLALIDSGCSFETYKKIEVFEDSIKEVKSFENINFSHGDTLGKIISTNGIDIYDMKIFDEKLNTSPKKLRDALFYLLDKDIDIIHTSLGLKKNYKDIYELLEKFDKKGVTIISSYPRSSTYEVFPASYEFCIKVTSDGLCKDDEIKYLGENIFGASPNSNDTKTKGSSVSAAIFTKNFCKYLSKGYTKEKILEILKGLNEKI